MVPELRGFARLAVSMGIGAVIAIAAPVGAQEPNQDRPANHDRPASVQSLPGDNLPPFEMLDANGYLWPEGPPPPGGYHPHTPETTAPGPTMEAAVRGAQAAIAACAALHRRGAATVIDSSGELRAALTADGADGRGIFLAHRKALVALAFKVPSIQAKALIANDIGLVALMKANMFVQAGAYPIVDKGQVIGAIGYSGGDDEQCARAGLEEIQKDMPDEKDGAG